MRDFENTVQWQRRASDATDAEWGARHGELAECCTEIGIDDDDDRAPGMLGRLLVYAVACVAAAAALVMWGGA